MSRLDEIRSKAEAEKYRLPGDDNAIHVIGISGGADSVALAVLLHVLFPTTIFRMIFTDTLAESPTIYESLDGLEDFLGRSVERLTPEEGLYELIDRFNGYLPSPKSRYCTNHLKLKPFREWIQSLSTEQEVFCYSGLRADEELRSGFSHNEGNIHSHFPYRDLGLNRKDVFSILAETVGVPGLYRGKTRSSCAICPYHRQFELLSTLRWEQFEFDRAMGAEKLTPADMQRFEPNVISVSKETRLASNHLTLPLPERIDLRTREDAFPVRFPKTSPSSLDTGLFKEKEKQAYFWVGAEFFIHPGVGDHGVWFQELVSFSKSRSGLVRQMKNHYEHRLSTPEVYGLDKETIQDELHQAIYLVSIPQNQVDLGSPEKGSYTWKQGVSLLQLKQHNEAILRTLHIAGMKQELKEYANAPELSWEAERSESLKEKLEKISGSHGEVLAMDMLDTTNTEKEETCCYQENLFAA